MADIKFKSWTHPKTGDVRVYASGVPHGWDCKIFVQRQNEKKIAGQDWEIKIQIPAGCYDAMRNKANIENAVDQALRDLVGFGPHNEFEKILEAIQ